ncbi:MAG: hypothetical protein IJ252_11560, partial [Solobacterium sp.]|nr:hypothetical protein [Solobacterium sp.]
MKLPNNWGKILLSLAIMVPNNLMPLMAEEIEETTVEETVIAEEEITAEEAEVIEEAEAAEETVEIQADEQEALTAESEFGYTYDRTGYDTIDSRLPYTVPTYIIYPNAKITSSEAADALLNEIGIIEKANEYNSLVLIVNPVGTRYDSAADLDQYINVLNSFGYVMNLKVIGIGTGADFVNNVISKNAWAVAGIMAYGGSANVYGTTIQVPAYLSSQNNSVNNYYINSNSAVKTGTAGRVTLYQNAENTAINVATANDATLAEAFENAWTYVFSKNFRTYNDNEEWYTCGLTKYRTPYEIDAYPIFEDLGLTYENKTALISANATEEKPNQWYEVFPEEIDSAPEASIPFLLVLHGAGNDNRVQIETSGWAIKAGEERIAVVAAEYAGTQAFGGFTGLGEDGTIELVKKLLAEHKSLDPSRVYVQGLSAGAGSSYSYAMDHPEVFTAVEGSSSPFMTGSAAMTAKAEEIAAQELGLPVYILAGTTDVYKPIPTTRGNGLVTAYAKANNIDVPEEMDFTANKYYGIQLDDQGYVDINGFNCLAGTLSNDRGVMMKVVAMEPYAHWNNPAMVDDIWEFFSQYRRNLETGKIEFASDPLVDIDDAIVDVTDYGFAYDKTADADEYDESTSFAVPAYIIYPDSTLTASQAQALMEEMGIIENVDKLHAKAFIVNPIGGSYSSKDTEAFLEVIDTLTAMSLNIKVIGIGNGATFVNNEISQKDWAVAGIMTYGGEAGPAPKYSVPAYISGSDAAAAYAQTNNATVKSAKGTINTYTNPDNKFEIVVENTAEETLAEAFANAWDNVFVKNGKVGNITGTWYGDVNANERQYEYFTYFDSAAVGLTRTVVNDVDFDGDGMMNLWYEYVPASASRAREGTVPMVLMLHGNANDPRTQISTSGWAPLAAKEGIILVEAEWQGGVVGGTQYDNMTDDENGILGMLEMVFEKYPAIDRERVYVEGLSAGSMKTLTLCLTHPEYFAGGGSHSGAVLGGSAALEEAVEKLAADYDIPWFFIGGEKDSFIPVSEKGGASSGVLAALNLFEKMNDMDITAWEDCDESKVEWFGFTKMEDYGEVENAGVCTVKGGTIKSADGNAMMSFNAIENWGHWNYEASAQLMWNFLKEHTLSEEKTIVTDTGFGYVYDRTAYNTVDGRLPYTAPSYLIYPDTSVNRYGAEALLNELGIIEHINEFDTKAYVINPVNRTWEDRADTENFISILDQMGLVANIKVIGIGAGADFVDKNISKNAWAVAGIMSYNSKANVKGTTIEVPAYVSNGVNAVNQYYIASNSAAETGTKGAVALYQNPDNELINVGIASDTSLAEAFQNAWKYVFSKNYRMYNDEEEWYTAGLTKYRDPYQINPYPMFDELGLTYKSKTGLITANATEERPNQWYEVFPEEIDTAAEASIPLLLVLHGNGNDNRTQIDSSGWATKAGKERIAIVSAEWQASRGTVIFGDYTALGEQGTIDLVRKILKEHPALDPGRVYVQGLSAGANATYTYGINHNDVFTAIQGSSSPFMTGSAAMTAKGEEIREAGTMIPAYVLAGTTDVYKPIPATRGNGLVTAYAKANGIDVSEELDFTANKYYGLQLENQGYYDINGQNVLAGTLSNDLGVMMKVVAMEPYAHWNNPALVDDVWEFWSQYRRNPETGKIEMVSGEDDRFADVRDESKYYYNAVYWARDLGITKGY